MRIEVVQLAFGTGVPRPLNLRVREYYGIVARSLFSRDIDESPVIGETSKTLAISAEHAVAINTVKSLIIGRYEDQSAETELDGVILDIGGPDENSLPGNNILKGLEFAIHELLESDPHLKIGVLLPTWFSESDQRPGYESLCVNPRVRFIATKNGQGHGVWSDSCPLDAQAFMQARSIAKLPPLDIIEKKLIRRIGHYKLAESEDFFRFFYDGSLCVSEIARVIQTQIKEHYTNIEHIYYDSHISSWFGAAISQALRGDSRAQRLRPIPDAAVSDEHFNERTLILLSIVRTGNTIRRLFSDRPPESGPKVWSLLTTEGPSNRRLTQSRPIRLSDPNINDGPTVEVQYALKVQPLSTYPRNVFDDMPELAVDPLAEDLSEPFGVATMWGMIFDSGLQLEYPVPPSRRRLGYVPSMGLLAEANGALIAAKVNAILDSRFGSSLSPTVIFLFPKEEHAERLIETLSIHSRRDAIAVHRQVIECFNNSNLPGSLLQKDLRAAILNTEIGQNDTPIMDQELDDLLENLTYLMSQTQSYSPLDQPEIVVIDEFSYSGGTIRGLCKLAQHFRLNVRCSISLASFCKQETSKTLVPHIPLYELDLDRVIADRVK